MKIRMSVSKVGYPVEGKEIDVSEDRAARWVLEMEIAEFLEKKDRVAIAKKIEQTKKDIAKADKDLGKKLDQIDSGEGV